VVVVGHVVFNHGYKKKLVDQLVIMDLTKKQQGNT
jgi:hypothetical protein